MYHRYKSSSARVSCVLVAMFLNVSSSLKYSFFVKVLGFSVKLCFTRRSMIWKSMIARFWWPMFLKK